MSTGKRYKFPGSQFAVQIGLAATVAVTAVTQADPGVVSAAAHGLDPGDVFKLDAIVGMTELNGSLYVAGEDSTTGTLELLGTDTTGYTAYVSGGTVAPVTFSNYCELTAYNQQDGAADEYDATTICSTVKEFEVGLSDSGTLQLDYLFAPNQPVQAALRAAKKSGEILAFRLALPKDGGTLLCFGSVQQQSVTGSNGSLWSGSATVRLTGEIVVLEAA